MTAATQPGTMPMSDAAAQPVAGKKTTSGLMLQSDKWQRISPLSILYYALKFIMAAVRNGVQALAPVAAVVATTGENRWLALGALAAVAAVGLLIGSILSYLNFKFRIDHDAFLIRSGVLTRKRLTLGFDRIQNVAFREPLYFRPFGLVILTLESAGSTSEEVNLAGIPRPLAQTIRQYVLDRKKTATSSPNQMAEHQNTGAAAEAKPAADLLRQPIGELARYGLSNNNIWVFAGITAGAIGQLDELWDSAFVESLFSGVGDVVGTGIMAMTTLVVFMVLVGLFLLMGTSVLGAIIINYKYHLTYQDERYHRTRGLFERQETSVPEVKVQSLKIMQPIIARLLGRFHLVFKQVGFEGKQNKGNQQKFIIPSVTWAFTGELAKRLFNNNDILGARLSPISTKFITRHAVFSFGIPSLLIGGLWTIGMGWYGLVPPVAVVVVVWPFIALRHRRYGFAINDTHAVVRSGLLGRTYTVFPLFKVQTMEIRQSPGQYRSGFADLKIKLAGQNLTIPYMPLNDARAWRAAAMQQVETSDTPWM